MAWLTGGLGYILPFLFTLTALVFVHELGHYLVARRNGVRVEVFSIGFGPELFGWRDRVGTRWKISAIPLGGYVKMFGDADASSMPGEQLTTMTEAEKAVSFHHKRLPQRAAVVAAGPIANFLFAIVIFAVMFATVGQPFTPPQVAEVDPGTAAASAGIKPGDTILAIDGHHIDRFEDIQQAVAFNTGTPIRLLIKRDGHEITIDVTPRVTEFTDRFGDKHSMGLLGIRRTGGADYVKLDPATAVWHATTYTWDLTAGTLKAVWQMIIGVRASDELSGPVGIVRMSGQVAQGGFLPLLGFAALLSVNLGLINLFPIPVLDGGHLLFYAAEAIRGRPLGQRAQEYGFRLGLALVMMLMVFATWNDLVRLKVVEIIRGLWT
jgi:regulator of sigma E protease